MLVFGLFFGGVIMNFFWFMVVGVFVYVIVMGVLIKIFVDCLWKCFKVVVDIVEVFVDFVFMNVV